MSNYHLGKCVSYYDPTSSFGFAIYLNMASYFLPNKTLHLFSLPNCQHLLLHSLQQFILPHNANIHTHRFTVYFYPTEIPSVLPGSPEITTRQKYHMRNLAHEEPHRMLAQIYAIHSKKPNKYFSVNDVNMKRLQLLSLPIISLAWSISTY